MAQDKTAGRRKGYTQQAEIGGVPIILYTHERDDGTLSSIRLVLGKQTADQVGIIDGLCSAINLGLENGVPLEEFVEEFTFTRFGPAGPVLGNDRVTHCTSILDYVFRELAISYLNRDDLANGVGGSPRRGAKGVGSRVIVADLLVRKAVDLSLISAMLEDQLAEFLAEMEARTPNEHEAHAKHVERMDALRALKELTTEVNEEIRLYAKGLSLNTAMTTASKVLSLRELFVDFVSSNQDVVDSGIRVSIAGGFIALFSAAGADMTFATPGLLAIFGGSKVVKMLKDIVSQEMKK